MFYSYFRSEERNQSSDSRYTLRSKFSHGSGLHDADVNGLFLPNRQPIPCSTEYSTEVGSVISVGCRTESKSCCSRRSNIESNYSNNAHSSCCSHSENHVISCNRSTGSVSQSSCCKNDIKRLLETAHNCRTCDMRCSDEENHSQCWQCRRIEALETERLPSDWCCPTSRCISRSKCCCGESSDKQFFGCSEEVKNHSSELQNPVQVFESERSCKSRYCSSHSSERGVSDPENCSRSKSSVRDAARRTEDKCLSWCRKLNPVNNESSSNCKNDHNQGVDDDVCNLANRTEKLQSKLGVPPLCSARLQPTRHRTKNAVLSIMESGEVCIELIKKKGSQKEERVVDVCRISSDGLRVSLCRII